MCRFVIYHGKRILLSDILTKPEHSLLRQASRRDAYTPGAEKSELYDKSQCEKRNHAVNADGFGLAAFDSQNRLFASLFKSVTPAWSNQNLAELCEVQYTDLLFAHIRAASPKMLVSEANCHPFRRGQFVFMHNGGISGFSKIRRAMLASFNDAVFKSIRGSTDSEHAFALFLTQFQQEDVMGPDAAPDMMPAGKLKRLTPDQFARGIRLTIVKIMEFQKQSGMTYDQAASSLNFAVSDGQCICVSRCRTHNKNDPPTLYYCRSNNCDKNDIFDIKCKRRSPTTSPTQTSHKQNNTSSSSSTTTRTRTGNLSSQHSTPRHKMHAISEDHDEESNTIRLPSTEGCTPSYMISSEPLDFCEDKWKLIPKDHMLLVYGDTCQLISLRLPSWDDIGSDDLTLTPCIRPVSDPDTYDEDNLNAFSLGSGNSSNNEKEFSKSLMKPLTLKVNSSSKNASKNTNSKKKKRTTLLSNRKDRHVGAFSSGFPRSPTASITKKRNGEGKELTPPRLKSSSTPESFNHPAAQRHRRKSEESRKKQQLEYEWQQQFRRTVITSIAVGASCLILGTLLGSFFGSGSSTTITESNEGGRSDRTDAIILERSTSIQNKSV